MEQLLARIEQRLRKLTQIKPHIQESRAAYIKAKLLVLVPSQIRSLRLKSINPPMPRQKDLALETGLHQSRISMFETPGAANLTLETLANIAAGLRVGVIVKFVPFNEMLRWENGYSQESFDVIPRLTEDEAFINPSVRSPQEDRVAEGAHQHQNGAIAAIDSNPGGTKKPMQKELAAGASAGVGG